MVRRKVEGDEEQRRAAGREAERHGERPSERGATTGASKQRTHLGNRAAGHDEKLATQHRGKQDWRAGDLAEEPLKEVTDDVPDAESYSGRGARPYGEEHEHVLAALAEAEQAREGGPVPLHEVARTAALPEDETRTLLHDLVATHDLVTRTEEPETPAPEPLYELKARR